MRKLKSAFDDKSFLRLFPISWQREEKIPKNKVQKQFIKKTAWFLNGFSQVNSTVLQSKLDITISLVSYVNIYNKNILFF